MLENDLSLIENWILSGAVCGWCDNFKSYFDLVIFLWIPQEIRLERLKQREFQRYENEILAGGIKYEQSKTFLEQASLYDSAEMEVRSKALHERWIAGSSCPVLKIEGNHFVNKKLDIVLDYLNYN